MSPSLVKGVAAAGLFAFSVGFLYHHLSTNAPIDAGRDATIFGSAADSSRTIALRTDFASFYYASKAAASGLNIYHAKLLDSLAAADDVRNHVLPYLYPPFFAVVAQPLAHLSPAAAQRVWDVLQTVLAAGVCLLVCFMLPWRAAAVMPRTYWLIGGLLCAAALVVLPFRENINFGQINVTVLLFIAICFHLYFRGRADWLAGAALAVATLIKVTPALFVVFFLINRRWKVVSGFFAGVFILLLATFDIAGRQPWQQFLDFLPNMGYARNVEGGFHPSIVANFSLAGFLMRLLPGDAAIIRLLTMGLAAALLAVVLSRHVKAGNERNETEFILPYLIVMLVASPVTWRHHLVYLMPGVVFALRGLWFETRRARRLFGIAAIALFSALAAMDFHSIYPFFSMPEVVRPILTSMNLWLLLMLLAITLSLNKTTHVVHEGGESIVHNLEESA